MRTKKYPSDTTREQFALIRPRLQTARKTIKPRTVDLYDVWCAVLYLLHLLRTGCQWRSLPSDVPAWQTVYAYFAKWSEVDKDQVSLLELALKNQVGAAREKQGKLRLKQIDNPLSRPGKTV